MAHNELSQGDRALRFEVIHYFHHDIIVIDGNSSEVSARSQWEVGGIFGQNPLQRLEIRGK